MNKIRLKFILCVVTLLCGIVSCNETDRMPSLIDNSSTTVSEGEADVPYTGEMVSIEFNATNSASTRSILNIEEDNDHPGIARIKWEKGKVYDVKLVMYDKKDPNRTTYADVKGTVMSTKVVNDPKSKDLMHFKGKVQLKSGELKGGEWYMQLFMGMPVSSWSETDKTYEMQSQSISDVLSMSIPVASAWTKMNVNNSGNHASADVTLKPLGSLMSFTVESPLYDELPITKVVINNRVFDDVGKFQLGNFVMPDQNHDGMPTWIPKEKTGENSYKSTFDVNYTLPANDSGEPKLSKKIYFWAYPKDDVNKKLQAKVFVSKTRDGSEVGIDTEILTIKDNIDMKSGKSYSFKFKLPESDLMITELFHDNSRSGSNCSMIELYNPTCRNIDLRNYFLVRLRTIYEEGGQSYGGFHPSDGVKLLGQAIRQDLYITNESTPVRTVDGSNATIHGDWSEPKNRYQVFYGTDNSSRYKPQLAPGKCIVVCGGGVLAYGNITDPNKSNYDAAYVPGGRAGKYIEKAIENNYCQYIIAVDNGQRSNAYQWRGTSGVMQHGIKHSMILVKGTNPIDAVGPFNYRTGEWRDGQGWVVTDPTQDVVNKLSSKFISDNYLGYTGNYSLSSNEDRYSVVRKPYAMYPSIYWDNNKVQGNAWDTASQWLLIVGVSSGASERSSWGTRKTIKEYVDFGFLDKYKKTGSNPKYDYDIYPKEYDPETPRRNPPANLYD